MQIYKKDPNFFLVGVVFPLPTSINIDVFIYLVPHNLKNDIEIGKRVEVPFGKNDKIKIGVVYELENFSQDIYNIKLKPIKKIIDKDNFFTKEMLMVSKAISSYYMCSIGEAIKLFLPKTKTINKNVESKKLFEDENLENFYSKKFLPPNPYQKNAIDIVKKSIKNNIYDEFLLFGIAGSGKTEVYLHLIKETLDLNKSIIYLVPEISLIPQTFLRLEIRFKGLVSIMHSQMQNAEKMQVYNDILSNKTKILIATRSGIFTPFRNLGLIIIDEEHDTSFKNIEKPFYDAKIIASFRAKILNIPIIFGSATPSIETYYKIKKDNIIEMPYKAKSLIFQESKNIFDIINSDLEKLKFPKNDQNKIEDVKIYEKIKIYDNKNLEKIENFDENNNFNLENSKNSGKLEKTNIRNPEKLNEKNQKNIENLEKFEEYRENVKFSKDFVKKSNISKKNDIIYENDKNEISIINMKLEILKKNFSMISEYLRKKILESLNKKKQVLLFLNRRGDSTFVFCRKCGFIYKCKNCDIPLVYHSDNENLVCHYCGFSIKNSKICPNCNSKYIKHFGFAIQKIEKEIKILFPEAKIARLDGDIIKKNKNFNEKIFKDFKNKKLDILIGTQIISKGLDFENIDLVGIISADTMLNLSDFRAGEKTFNLLVQTLGRAGRGEKGNGIIQTYYPDNYAIKAATKLDYKNFFQNEIKWRKELFYPPFSRLILLTMRSKNEILAKKEIYSIYEKISNINKVLKNFIILGPYKPDIYKKYNNFYYQILIKIKLFDKIDSKILEILKNYKNINTKLSIEIDPL